MAEKDAYRQVLHLKMGRGEASCKLSLFCFLFEKMKQGAFNRILI